MTDSILDTCLAATGRTYPAGYGFALCYLDGTRAGPDHFKAMQSAAWGAVQRHAKAGNDDAAAFVAAFTDSRSYRPLKGWTHWLVEAAQLVLSDAISGNRKAGAVMAMWGHPGYD